VRHLAAVAALVVLIALVYGGTVDHGFVFDDQSLVVDNEAVRLPLSRAHELLLEPEAGIAYRPLRIFSYMVDYQIAGGLDPAVFHASNLVYHGAVTLALYALAVATIGSIGGALCAAALFAVHPLGSEAVVYVAGRRDLLSTLCVLLGLLCWLAMLRAPGGTPRGYGSERRRGLGAGGIVALTGMIVFAVLGVAAKEMAIVLPVLALLLWAADRARGTRAIDGGRVLVLLAASVLALAIAGVWLYAAPLGSSLSGVVGGALAPQPAFSLRVLGQYLLLAIWPSTLSADYRAHAFALPTSALDGPSIVAAFALAAVAVVGLVLLRRGSMGGVGLLWFLVALAPVAQLVPYSEVVSEHNAYLALAGLALAIGDGVAMLARRHARPAVALATVLVVLLGVRSHVRAQDWRDNLTLWRATLAVAPGSIRGQHNLGVALLGEGDLLGARDALERAVSLGPDDREALLTLATLQGRLGEFDRAHELAERAVAVKRDGRSLMVLGWARLSRGQETAAIPLFEEAIEAGGDIAEARRGLARARAGAGRF